MPLEIIRNDITKMQVDAIVNPTNAQMYGIAGVDGAIHQLSGPKLKEETDKLGRCGVGEAKLTESYNMPSKYIIHTVGPIWKDGQHGEDELLANCYRNSLNTAMDNQLESIAIPLISSGTFGYPKDKALRIAISAIGEFLLNHDLLVYLVVYDKKAYQLSEMLFSSIKEYIDDHYVDEHQFSQSIKSKRVTESDYLEEMSMVIGELVSPSKKEKRKLEDIVKHIDDTFSQMLLRLIDERGLNDPDVYKKANVNKRHFSKIRNDKFYQPSKPTVLAFAIALELNLDETKDLLLKAGFALSNSSKFDLIIKYFIEEGIYNIFEVNEALFAFDEKTIGV